jgi:hypothetical protein
MLEAGKEQQSARSSYETGASICGRLTHWASLWATSCREEFDFRLVFEHVQLFQNVVKSDHSFNDDGCTHKDCASRSTVSVR